MSKVLDEIGIEMGSKLESTPRTVLRRQVAEEDEAESAESELERRLKGLKSF